MDPLKTRSGRPSFRLEDGRRLTWYACLFDSPTVIHEGGETYTEVVRPGAFDRTLAARTSVIANVDHDPARTFAATADGTLLLQTDPKGLFCSCWLPETALGDVVLDDVQSGRLAGASFRFVPTETREAGGVVERVGVTLADVCVTATPAYPDTLGEVHVRTVDRNRLRAAYLLLQARFVRAKYKW